MREIRFFPDHGMKYPIWESGTDKYAMDPEDFDLSDSLGTRLRELMTFWSKHFVETDTSFEWDTAENEQRFWAEGDSLIDKLRKEVEDFAIVLDQRRH